MDCRPGTAAAAALVIGVTIALGLRGIARTPLEQLADESAREQVERFLRAEIER